MTDSEGRAAAPGGPGPGAWPGHRLGRLGLSHGSAAALPRLPSQRLRGAARLGSAAAFSAQLRLEPESPPVTVTSPSPTFSGPGRLGRRRHWHRAESGAAQVPGSRWPPGAALASCETCDSVAARAGGPQMSLSFSLPVTRNREEVSDSESESLPGSSRSPSKPEAQSRPRRGRLSRRPGRGGYRHGHSDGARRTVTGCQ